MRRGRARRRRAISRQVSSLAAQFVQSIHTRGVGRSLCSAGQSRAGGAVQACWCFSLCPSGLQGHCCQGPALCAEDTHPGSRVVTNFQNLCAQRLGLESSCWSGCWNIHRGAAVTHGMDSAPLFSLGTFCGASSRAHAQHEGNQDRSLNCRLEAGSCEAGQQPRLPPSPSGNSRRNTISFLSTQENKSLLNMMRRSHRKVMCTCQEDWNRTLSPRRVAWEAEG